MTGKTTCFVVNVVVLTILLVAPRVISDDATPIPSDKTQVNSWFQSNVQAYSARKDTLDPALATAESNATIIKVRQDGTGDFKTVMDAINSIPSGNTDRVIVSIGGGVYQEKIKIDRTKPFVTLCGSANAMPTLVYGATAAKVGTVDSATVIVESDYFMAANLIFKNSAPIPDGKSGEQALAIRISGDKAAFYHCRFIGFQDTVCDDKGMHFFKDCYIEGTVDFIFGNGKSLYLNTDLYVLNSGGYTMITAHARNGASEDTGYSFVHCSISGTAQNAVLGRAWMASPRVVYSYTQISSIISPEGWSDNFHPDRDSTVFFGEYSNSGPGADHSKRAKFSKLLSDAEAKPFLSLSFIQGSKWLLPPANV